MVSSQRTRGFNFLRCSPISPPWTPGPFLYHHNKALLRRGGSEREPTTDLGWEVAEREDGLRRTSRAKPQ